MPAYVIVRVNVTDTDTYSEYMKHTPATVAQYGGKFVVRGGDMTTLEGDEETRRVVVLQFDTVDAAKTWYHSPEYQAAKAIREGAADAQFIAIDGA